MKREIIGIHVDDKIYIAKDAQRMLVDKRVFAMMHHCDLGEKWNPDQYPVIAVIEEIIE